MRKLIVLTLLLTGLGLSSCYDPYYTDTGSTGSGSQCFIGTWQTTICDGYTRLLSFSSNGMGYFNDVDCTNICKRTATFYWEETSTGVIYYDYQSFTICGEDWPISPGSQTYSCSGTSLTIGGSEVYTKY